MRGAPLPLSRSVVTVAELFAEVREGRATAGALKLTVIGGHGNGGRR